MSLEIQVIQAISISLLLARSRDAASDGTMPKDSCKCRSFHSIALMGFSCCFYVAALLLYIVCSDVLHVQVFGIIFTICQGKIMDKFSILAGNIFLCVFLVIGTIMTGKTAEKQDFYVTNNKT